MTWLDRPLTNSAYGYPKGNERRVAPIALVCIHGTANPNDPPATAIQERNFADRVGSNGPSAHTYGDRGGGGVHAIDTKYAAWSNGVLRTPKLGVPGIRDIVAFVGSGFNANEAYVREIELCSRYAPYPITPEQKRDLALLIAADSVQWGLPISRRTVHLHSDLDTEQRPNCPVPAATAEAFVAEVIALAQGVAMTIDELLAELKKQIDGLKAERDNLEREVEELVAKIAAAKAALA